LIVAANNSPPPPSVTDHLKVGDRVLVGGTNPGTIAFVGEVHFGAGDWAGVFLDTPTGKNDGRVGSHRYFVCEPKRGVFCRLGKLTKLPDRGTASPVTTVDSDLTSQLEKPQKSNSPNQFDSVAGAPYSSPKVADPSVPAIVVDKPSSPVETIGSHNSDHGMPPTSDQAPSNNQNNDEDNIDTRSVRD